MSPVQLPSGAVDEHGRVKVSQGLSVDMAKVLEWPQEKQEAFARDVLAYKRLIEENPLADYFPASEKHEAFHAARERVKAFIAANRAGKTKTGIADDVIQAIPPESVPAHLLPFKKWGPDSVGWPFKGRIITPDFGRTMAEVQEQLRDICPKAELKGGSFDEAYSKQERVLRFTCGSLIDFMTHEQDLDKFGGVARHRVHYDEEPPEDIRNASRKRLIDYTGDEIFTFTPEFGISWSHEALEMRRHEDGIFVIHATIWDNPHLPRDEILVYLEGLTEEQRQIAELGQYAALGGTFYPEYNDDLHVVGAPETIEDQDAIVVGIDPGLNTTAVIWIAFDNDNSALVFDELYCHKEIPAQIAPKMKAKNREWGVEHARYVIDPSARNRATVNAEAVEGEFARAGIFCEPGQNDRAAGITEVKRRLQKNQLVVSKECQGLRREFPRYRRDHKSTDEWAAIKKDDHGLDALRYGLMARAWNLPTKTSPKRRKSTHDYQAPYNQEYVIRPSPPLGAF